MDFVVLFFVVFEVLVFSEVDHEFAYKVFIINLDSFVDANSENLELIFVDDSDFDAGDFFVVGVLVHHIDSFVIHDCQGS